MALPIIPVVGVLVLSFFLYRFLYATDMPKIAGIPEIPGLPLFGSLIELGTNHAKVAQGWAKKYGPVFQVRMGNRVCTSHSHILPILPFLQVSSPKAKKKSDGGPETKT